MSKKLLLVIGEDRSFLTHREPIAALAKSKGWDVTIVTHDTGRRADIERMGYKYTELPINLTGMNLSEEARTFRFLYSLCKENKDAIVHLVGLKNMLWGGTAARLNNVRGVVFAVSGLGTLFGEKSSKILAWSLLHFLRYGMHKRNINVIFQNHVDQGLFVENKLARRETLSYTKGAGANLDEYCFTPAPSKKPLVVIFTGRMLEDKGVPDLIKAAEILRPEYEGKVVFRLFGTLSTNPSALTEDDLLSMTDGKYIKWFGHHDDICSQLKQADIMCFPSYYREGVPKSLIEASAIGRPLVTTDSVGCRDTVEDGVNGFIVPPHSPEKIAEALKKLIDDPELRQRMGRESRRIAERDYDVNRVADIHLDIYEKLYQASLYQK